MSDKPGFYRALQPQDHPEARGRDPHAHARALGVAARRGRSGGRDHRRARGASGELDNTYVIFTSDHGYMQGEHRIRQGKMLPYDPSTQVPLLIRGPGIPRGRSSKALVGNIDLAPTILQATSTRLPRILDGRSILPFARNPRLRSFKPLLHETAGNGARGKINTREGGAQRPAAARARLARGAHNALALRGVPGRLHASSTTCDSDPCQMRLGRAAPRPAHPRRTLRRILGDLSRCKRAECGRIAAASVR